MKLILFLLIIVVIYFIASRIKVVHSDLLSTQEKKELDDRNKIRSMLMYNHIRCANSPQQTKPIENFSHSNSNEYSIDSPQPIQKIGINEVLNMIKFEFLDKQYFFNMSNRPVATRNSNINTKKEDKKYIKHIKNNINEWNQVLPLNSDHIKTMVIKPIFIKETDNEFVITVNAKLLYLNKTLHLQLTYYGKIEKTDDFLNGGTDTYILQLVNIKPITKFDFSQLITTINCSTTSDYEFIAQGDNNTDPFISMAEQMAYVNKINKIHENEEYY